MDDIEKVKEITSWANKYDKVLAQEAIAAAVERFDQNVIALASSFGAEDQVLTHILRTHYPQISIFTIDTGRLNQETYDCMDATMKKYNFQYDVLGPDIQALAKLISQFGPNMFYTSVQSRKSCCYTRKVEPLQKKLATLSAWICGLRREQSITRSDIQSIEWDYANKLVKINPLAYWSEQDVWNYIKENNIPYNKLHDQGYSSIGCAPCTRAIKLGEDVRAGRWWWEAPEHKECGLHKRPGNESSRT